MVVPILGALVCLGALLVVGLLPGSCDRAGGGQARFGAHPVPPPLPAAPCDTPLRSEDLYARMQQMTVTVVAGDSLGSGVLVDPRVVATNAHVVAAASTTQPIIVNFSDDSLQAGKASWMDPDLDLALITLSQHAPAIATPADMVPFSSVRGGQPVAAMGAPLGMQWTFTQGHVSAVRTDGPGGQPAIQFDAAASPGNSGGPLTDACGRLIGLVTFGAVGGENLNFARPAELLRPHLMSDAP